MDISSFVVIAAFILYGWSEYRRREKAHQETLDHLLRGDVLPDEPKEVEPWRLVTTGAVLVLLLVFVGALLTLGLGGGKVAENMPLWAMGVVFLVPLVLLALIFLRDFKHYREQLKGRRV